MKRQNNRNLFITVILLAAMIFALLTVFASSEPRGKQRRLSALAYTLYDPENDSFIYANNSEKRLPMASTTKIMTAILALESATFDDLVSIDPAAIGTEGSSAYLKEGEVLTLEELLYALLLQSANDAAVAIACYIGGSIEEFARMMNDCARDLGLSDTNFTNPHGLHNDDHYTTAEDLARLAAHALNNPLFKEIVSTTKMTFSRGNRRRTYINHNKLLRSLDGCIGVKTGYTKRSGRCLVSAAERDGIRLIAVTLDAPDDWNDHKKMYSAAFDILQRVTLLKPSEYSFTLPVIGGIRDSVTVTNEVGVSAIIEKDRSVINSYIKLSKFAVAPISKGQLLGEVVFTKDGEFFAKAKLTAKENISEKKRKSFFDILFKTKNTDLQGKEENNS